MLADSTWRPLYKIGGIAALAAAILFCRYIGAEVLLDLSHFADPANHLNVSRRRLLDDLAPAGR